MPHDDLTRVRNDLDTIQTAIGLPPRWDPREVRINLLFAAAGLAALIWALAPHGFSPVIGFCFFAVPVFEWLRTGQATDPHLARREFRGALRTLLLALPLIGLFAWCRQMGLTPITYLGLATFVIGATMFSAALGEPQSRRSLGGWAAALMIGGLLLPMELAPVVAVLAAALTLGGLTSAALVCAAREDATHAAG